MSAALFWIHLNNTGPDLGVVTGMYPPKEPRFIILRYSSNLARPFIYAFTLPHTRAYFTARGNFKLEILCLEIIEI